MTEQPPRSGGVRWVVVAALIALAIYLAVRSGVMRIESLRPDEIGQIFYLVVLIGFVGAALLGRGLGAGEVVRGTLAWLAVMLLLVGAYAYRDELTGVGARLLAVLVPGVPLSGRLAGDADTGSVVVERSIDGHFGILATVDGAPLTLLVDTGASFVTLTTADAARIGISPSPRDFNVSIRTANGPIKAAAVTVKRIAIGPIVRTNVPALVAPPASLDQSLLGMSYLNTLKSYAIAGDRLILKP